MSWFISSDTSNLGTLLVGIGTLLGGIGTAVLALIAYYKDFLFNRWKKEKRVEQRINLAKELLDQFMNCNINKWLRNINFHSSKYSDLSRRGYKIIDLLKSIKHHAKYVDKDLPQLIAELIKFLKKQIDSLNIIKHPAFTQKEQNLERINLIENKEDKAEPILKAIEDKLQTHIHFKN